MEYDLIRSLDDIEYGAAVLIYGTGETGQELFVAITRSRPDITVKCFVDSYKYSGNICSIPLINVSEIKKFCNCKVIIASIFHEEIAATLKSHDCYFFSVFHKDSGTLDPYEDMLSIVKERMTLLKELPRVDDESVFYIFNVRSRGDDKRSFFNCIGCTDLPFDSYVFSDLLDYDFEKIFREKDKYKSFCLVDVDGRKSHLVGLVRYITDVMRKKVALYKMPSRNRNFSIIEGMQLLFLHIHKNATSSTRNALIDLFAKYKHDSRRYSDSSCYDDITDSFFDGYTKFTIVRSPYDRLASLFCQIKNIAPDKFLYPVLSKYVSPFSFENFCKFVADCPDEFSDLHFQSQTYFLTFPNGMMSDIRLLRMESYSEDIKSFFEELGEEIEILHMNQSRPNKVDYIKDYYTPELIKLVNERYEQDFINFGYEFL